MEEIDFNRFDTYAPVASHEAVRIIFYHGAPNILIFERGCV